MRTTCLLFIWLTSLVFTVVLPAVSSAYSSDNMVFEHIGEKTLRVLNVGIGMPPEWFLSSATGFDKLKNPPATQQKIFAVKASPDKKFLAVLSAGEGHPEIDIFSLSDIIADKKTKSILTVDPYPGIIDISHWDGQALHMLSDMLLPKRNSRPHESLTLFSAETFLLDMFTGNISPASEKLKKPVSYYGRHLIEEAGEGSPYTELNALDHLNDIKALPFLQKAIRMKIYQKNKDDILQLIKKLERHDRQT